MAENIKSRKYYRVHNGTDWDRMHFVTDANSVDANDGDNMETKVGAIKGITTSTSVTEEGYAADATTVAALNESLGQVRIYVGEDGKLHFVDASGADSVLPFNNSEPIVIDELYHHLYSGHCYISVTNKTTLTVSSITFDTNSNASWNIKGRKTGTSTYTVLSSNSGNSSNIKVNIAGYDKIQFNFGASVERYVTMKNIVIS